MADFIVLEGRLSVTAALLAGNRDLHTIYLEKGHNDSALRYLLHLARERGVPVHSATTSIIERYSQGNTHGGVLALAGQRRYLPLEALAQAAAAPFVVMLDGVEDPFNYGQAIRALYAAGAHGLVVRARNWETAAGVVARASAGASEFMPTALAETPLEALEHFAGRGWVVACAANDARAVPLYEADLTGLLFLLIGGEKRGITRSVRMRADLWLCVPYSRLFEPSLGTTSAAAVLALEVMRQRTVRNAR